MRVWFAGGGTGGHLYPALGIARALVQLRPEVRPLFIGARRGIERDVLPRTEFEHILLELHPLYRSRVWLNWKTVVGALGAWRSLRALAQRDPPAAIVATGGYAAALALMHSRLRGVPIALQEQNSVPGLTTRYFSRFARQIHLGFPEAARMLPPAARAFVRESGNPIEPLAASDANARMRARERWGLTSYPSRVLLVFGGSQGAHAINAAVGDLVRAGVPAGLQLVWITGTGEHAHYATLNGPDVRVVPFLTPMSDAYAAADLALARAGAMSTAEMCAWGIPMLLVPLPTAAADHQMTNARALERAGAAIVIPQRELTANRLRDELSRLLADASRLSAMAQAARNRARPTAAEDIARDVDELIRPAARA